MLFATVSPVRIQDLRKMPKIAPSKRRHEIWPDTFRNTCEFGLHTHGKRHVALFKLRYRGTEFDQSAFGLPHAKARLIFYKRNYSKNLIRHRKRTLDCPNRENRQGDVAINRGNKRRQIAVV